MLSVKDHPNFIIENMFDGGWDAYRNHSGTQDSQQKYAEDKITNLSDNEESGKTLHCPH